MSTAEQADSRAGLSAQESVIRSECDRRGWDLVRLFTDAGASGSSFDRRPELAEALNALERGEADTLVVAKFDRLSRSIVDLAILMERARKHGWRLAILDTDVDTTTASGELIANVMGSVAQWERRMIGERTKAALAVRKAEGVTLGRPRSVPQSVCERVAHLRKKGLSYQAVADTLNKAAVPTGQGGARWYPSSVRKLHLRTA